MKKSIYALLLVIILTCTTACGKQSSDRRCHCNCDACKSCEYKENSSNGAVDAKDVLGLTQKDESSENPSVSTNSDEISETGDTSLESITESIEASSVMEAIATEPVATLTEGEKQARRQLQKDLMTAREQLYSLPASKEKTLKINEYDKLILANNCYDFSDKAVQIIGDSITEGICASTDADGNYISYHKYMNDYLNIGNMMVNGKAGRTYADYGNENLCFEPTFKDNIYIFADATVIFLGFNDYMAVGDSKRYGDLDYNSPSTAGYCGALREIAKYYASTIPDVELFFVTTYNMDHYSPGKYSDAAVPPTYADFMNMIKSTAQKSGAHVIDLYNTGFMDCTDAETNRTYLADGIHPNDAGNKILGEHIAAELAYYFSQNK